LSTLGLLDLVKLWLVGLFLLRRFPFRATLNAS